MGCRRDRRFGRGHRRSGPPALRRRPERGLASRLDGRRYNDSFQVCRTAYIINALLGSIGAKADCPSSTRPREVGRKGLKKLVDLFPKPEEKRADGVGWKYPQFDGGPGLVNLAYDAIVTGEPYPVKAYLCFRHDPLMAMPDPEALKKKWAGLDLLVSITFSWSDTGLEFGCGSAPVHLPGAREHHRRQIGPQTPVLCPSPVSGADL